MGVALRYHCGCMICLVFDERFRIGAQSQYAKPMDPSQLEGSKHVAVKSATSACATPWACAFPASAARSRSGTTPGAASPALRKGKQDGKSIMDDLLVG